MAVSLKKKVRFVDLRTSYPFWPGVVVQNAVKVSFVDDRNGLHLDECVALSWHE